MNQIELNKLQSETYEHLWDGRYRLALKTSKTLLNERPNDSEAAICYAWALLENGNPTKAMDYANLAVELDSDSMRTHLCRGYILMRLGIFEGSISDLNKTIDDQRELLSWSYLNKARALAGMGKYDEAKLSLKLGLLINNGVNPGWNELNRFYDTAINISKDKISITSKNVNEYIELAKVALKEKESWFTLFLAQKILLDEKLKKYHDEFILLELDALLHSFQFRPALNKADTLREKFAKNKRFKQIFAALEKMQKSDEEEDEEIKKLSLPRTTNELKLKKTLYEDDITQKKKTGVRYYPNDNIEVFSIKVYDQLDFSLNKRKKYYEQFDIKTIKEIGLEVVFNNPFFRLESKVYNCIASWYLNDFVIYKNKFSVQVEKNWDSVIFNQQCGSLEDISWSLGQGKVELYFEGFKVCEKWFFIDQSSIFETRTIEKTTPEPEDSRIDLQKPETQIPSIKIHEKPTRPIEELLEELDSYTGLSSIKKSVRDFIAFLKFQKQREKLGLKADEKLSINAIFTGNPGTGKTTIARLLGEIFKSMSIIEKGHVVETDRTGLVGQYIGETAQKTEKVINEAIGGVLFIDEAYTLVKPGGGGQDFGREAVDVLLKRMEDRKGEFVVIAAGYPEEMEIFLSSNPGLKSRFNHTFVFDDYTPDELMTIFKSMITKEEYTLEDKAEEILKKELIKLYRSRDKSFGNARIARQFFEMAKLILSKRVIEIPKEKVDKQTMTTITENDIREIFKTDAEKEVKLPIDEETLTENLIQLEHLVGLESVKNEIKDLVKLARYFMEKSEDVKNKFSSHIIFLGNPGTGKTTVARILSRIYSALGILPQGHLVETDRQGLVASHIGGTAEKAKAMIDKAIGGTLFIDEAYTLAPKDSSSQDFGKEAIDTLLKRMEDDRGKFIVIAAGYTDEMKAFIESNPGIQSRFTKVITFEDYNPTDLMEITHRLIKSNNLQIDQDVVEELLKHYNEIYRTRDKNFGNARIVRNIVDKVIQKRLVRIADLKPEEREKEENIKIIKDDVAHAITGSAPKSAYIIKGDQQKLEQHLEELKSLIGLDSVKESVEKLIASLKVAKLREERGLKVFEKNLHAAFAGNPGTGKTTVARLLSKIYKELGIIEKGHLIEVDRSALVAGYQGQTAIKTEKVIDRSLGGTLFIDEAYTLARGQNDFGQEAIDALLKRMEDYKGKFVVIVAGYTNEMKRFLDSNPGLRSRFSNHFSFEDYTPRQLLSIAVEISEGSGYKFDEGALQLLLEVFTSLYGKRDKTFGNARTAKNILYKAISYQEERISSMYDYSNEDLMTITYDDVAKITANEYLN